jgi:hypothetical protein
VKYLKNYESFESNKFGNEVINEEIFGLGALLKTATGAFKNFLGGIMQPFKNLKDDFKKGLKFEQVKGRFINAINLIQKNTTNNILKAKDEGELNKMVDAFKKEIEAKMVEFDKEIKMVKESKIYEGVVQDALIGGRVLFGMFKDEMSRLKTDFDKKFAAAKDLNAKKQARIAEIKAVVDNFKKKINDEKLIKDATEKYKEENKVEAGGGDSISDEVLKSYSTKEKPVTKLADLTGLVVRYKREEYDDNKKPEDQEDLIAKGTVKTASQDTVKIYNDKIKKVITKESGDILPKQEENEDEAQKDLKTELGKIKEDPEKMKSRAKVIKVMNDKPEVQKKINDIIDDNTPREAPPA